MIPNLAQQACSAAARQKSAELAEASDDRAGPLQQDILAILHAHPAGRTSSELAEALEVIRQNIDCSLRGLMRRGTVVRIDGYRDSTHRKGVTRVGIYRIHQQTGVFSDDNR